MSKKTVLTAEQTQVIEIWHNLFRMHSYVEAALLHVSISDKLRPPLLQRADLLLRASFERARSLVPDDWHNLMEQPNDWRSGHEEQEAR